MYKKGRTPFCRQTVAPTRVEADKDTPKLNRLRTYFYTSCDTTTWRYKYTNSF